MDDARFDGLAKSVAPLSTRRSALAMLSALGVGSALIADAEAKKHKKKKKCKKGCALCRKCKKGKCKPQPDGTACGGGATCQGGACVCPTACCVDADCGACETCETGQCVDECRNDQVCDGDTCVCPAGQKECQGACIANNECCGACPSGQTCCTNIGDCKDLLNDPAFCGLCTNGQCPGGAICTNGDCGLTCTPGLDCFTGCVCSTRVDPAHTGQHVCAGLGVFTCDTVATCSDDAGCGFRRVCVSDLCAAKNVCADPCA
jgi:hypothetical protein